MKRCLAVILLMVSGTAAADFEMQYSDGTFGLVGDGRVLFGDANAAVLFVPGEEGMVVISHEERTWMRLKPGFVKDVKSQMQTQMDAMLAGMPPEQRAMVEQQMAGMMPQPDAMPKMEIRKTGTSAEVAGFDCDEIEIAYDTGGVEEVVCVATARELGISNDDFDAMLRAMEGMAEIASMGGGEAAQLEFSKLGGIPVRTRARGNGEDNEVVSIETSSVDPARLQIPDNYRETSIESMMGG
ncbi:MAG: DUF4412 domain-containing protein [Woeseia sp.]|nr:DUF4412 domain-containing protein [Woeseia sp.]MBT8097598.1 DUF4412 domain-containing protein [Woeseia sp.]NNE61431.1 DUF4412 domain-containing protein [Woeseia sp.]NNL53913.1 DUF4412 domain-containing protein [Woeseia sp.]